MPPSETPDIVEFASAPFGIADTDTVGLKVNVPPEFVIVCPTVTPFEVAADEVASTIAPLCVVPKDCFTVVTPVALVR